jgi:hypothetical protein
MRDFIPKNWAAFAVWFANFVVQLAALKTKYNIQAATLSALEADNDWVQFWTEAKAKAKLQTKQLTDFTDGVRKGKIGSTPLSNPVWDVGAMPATVPPGINERVRETANFIKAQKSIYTSADGELLGIITAEEANLNEQDFQPALKFVQEPNYNLEADFRLFGTDALRIEYRHKGGDWQLAAILTSSPGTFNIVPLVAGSAEQIEIRAIFIVKNEKYGQYSPIYTVVIAP